ncbi:flagellar hook protein FlgE [Tardiphaga sp.]|uniref:flagellar hook protein FlgE n=1 Tax=Tardiphaga sp. TaxID=1926292 RepID=UPI0025F8F443|nr:flagellar hook protein FlgE [Tardiphaga sp.]
MSLYSALYAGVSGLNAQSAAMATVADNITNINTVGYKGEEAQFQTLVSGGQVGGSYSAGGVVAAPKAMISKQGVLQASASKTDLGINGNGFFVTRDGTGASDKISYTRAGSFTPNKEGYLSNAAGYYLQGWRLDSTGNYINNGSLAALEPIKVNQLTGTAVSTTRIEARINLQSTATAFTGTYTVGSIAAGTTAPTFSRPVQVYDAQGGVHNVTLGFLKTGPNTWAGEIYAVPAADVTATGGVLASGKIAFHPDGSLDKTNSSPALFGGMTVGWTNGAGAAPVQLKLGSDGGLDGLTQFGGESALISSSVDGGMLGNVASIDISESGIVSAVFDDGPPRAVFQLPLATFQNPEGLTRLPGNNYTLSPTSGNVAINSPGALGSGKIAASMLEASTVDLAQEFTNMIRFQRAYSASSKIITTVDEMLQEVSALKR